MNNVDFNSLESENKELIKQLRDNSSLKEVSVISSEEKNKLSMELFNLISGKSFNDNSDSNKVIELIEKGADVNYKDEKKGDFPLLICARKNYTNTFFVLIKYGADVNLSNNYKTTSLMASARHGNEEILTAILFLGADVNAKCIDLDTALMSAVRHNQDNCINVLMSFNANLNSRNIFNQSIVDIMNDKQIDISLIKDNSLKDEIKEDTQKDYNNLINEAEEKLGKIKQLKLG